MTRDILVQYCDLKGEIEKLEERINRIEKQSEMIADVVQNGYKGRTVVRGYDYNRSCRLKHLKTILHQRYDKALQMQTDIETYINTIPKSDIRQIFEHRYIDGLGWNQIQILMKYRHEDTARRKHDRFLEKNL